MGDERNAMKKTTFLLVGGCLGRINNDLNIDAGISTYSQLRNIIWNIDQKMNRYQRYAFDWEQIDPTSFEDDTPCMGPGWTKQNGLCWRVFRRKRKGVFQTKADLKSRCMKVQGRLIGPEDDAENELIYTYLASKGFQTHKQFEFFLGINDGMTEGEYKFDNSPLQVAYTNFAPDAETNVEGVNEVVYKFPEKTWGRRASEAIAGTICVRFPGVRRMSKAQKDPENNINTFLNEGHIERMEQYVEANLGIGALTYCPAGWTEVWGRCWLLRNKMMNKKAAKTWCFHKGATLLQVSSQTDQNSLIQFLNYHSFPVKATSTIWLAINDGKSEGNFKIDNTCTKKGKSQEAIDSCLDATYTNFSSDPDNINDDTKNSVYYSHVTESWYYAKEDATAKFICEKGKFETAPPAK